MEYFEIFQGIKKLTNIFIVQGTDTTLLAKLHKENGTHKNYLKPKSDANPSFGLNHFAGVVFYDTRGKK